MLCTTNYKIISVNLKKYSKNKIFKRYMHNTKNYLGRVYAVKPVMHEYLYAGQYRKFSLNTDWSYRVRVAPPATIAEIKPQNLYWDKKTGFQIMHPKDFSGKNHIHLSDERFLSDDYYLLYGSFTSSSSPIKGILPEKVSDYQFTLKNKPQYFLRYPKSILIRKEDAKLANLYLFSSKTINGGENKPLTEAQEEAKKFLSQDIAKFLKTVLPVEQDIY